MYPPPRGIILTSSILLNIFYITVTQPLSQWFLLRLYFPGLPSSLYVLLSFFGSPLPPKEFGLVGMYINTMDPDSCPNALSWNDTLIINDLLDSNRGFLAFFLEFESLIPCQFTPSLDQTSPTSWSFELTRYPFAFLTSLSNLGLFLMFCVCLFFLFLFNYSSSLLVELPWTLSTLLVTTASATCTALTSGTVSCSSVTLDSLVSLENRLMSLLPQKLSRPTVGGRYVAINYMVCCHFYSSVFDHKSNCLFPFYSSSRNNFKLHPINTRIHDFTIFLLLYQLFVTLWKSCDISHSETLCETTDIFQLILALNVHICLIPGVLLVGQCWFLVFLVSFWLKWWWTWRLNNGSMGLI